MKRIKNVFNFNNKPLIRSATILIILFVIESIIWNKLNYIHKPNEVSLGNFIAFFIFLASSIIFVILIIKRFDKWALLVLIHIIGLFLIDKATLNAGWNRHLDSLPEIWEFKIDNLNYEVQRDKQVERLTINEITQSELYSIARPVVSGKALRIKSGWRLVNDTLDIKIFEKTLIGFPNQRDTIKLKKQTLNSN